jgi:hypothetical protein
MKKISFLSSVFLLVVVVTFLFIGCQKESAVSEEETTIATSSDAEKITATVNGTQEIIGLVSKDDAEKMAEAFAKRHPEVITKSVGYSTKNMIAFLSTLLVKYKSDSVFVYYGLYDKETAPKPSYIGKSTIFFMGKNKGKKASGNIQLLEDETTEKSSNYLNRGEVFDN